MIIIRYFGKGKMLNDLKLKPHNVLLSYTTPEDYDMGRSMLLEGVSTLSYNEYLLLEGGHCSCYGFDETEWSAIVYTKEELIKLANADYNRKSKFWNMVLNYFN
ncbi:hypothetical protein ND433_12485 [Clostridioides difficile]|nr:hypothetical protein [Clostridioides difficile]